MKSSAEIRQALLSNVLKEDAPPPVTETVPLPVTTPAEQPQTVQPPATTPAEQPQTVPLPNTEVTPPVDDGTSALQSLLDSEEPANFEDETPPPPPETQEPELPETLDESESPQQSFANLRKALKATKAEREQAAKKVQELEQRVAKFQTGEEIPEPLKDVHARVTELEHYKNLVSLKANPEYEKQVLAPLTDTKTKLLELAKAYGVAPEKLGNVFNNRDVKFRNTQLAGLLKDPVAVLEAKNLLTQIDNLHDTQAHFEKQPGIALEQMVAAEIETRNQNVRERLGTVRTNSSSAWVKALNDIRKEGKIFELIPQEGNHEHNQKWVNPIVDKAAKQYGLIVKSLVEAGLRELPEKAAYAIARAVQQAYAAGSAAESRQLAIEEADRVRQNAQRRTVYERPPMGSGTGAPRGGGVPTRTSFGENLNTLKNSVLKGPQ